MDVMTDVLDGKVDDRIIFVEDYCPQAKPHGRPCTKCGKSDGKTFPLPYGLSAFFKQTPTLCMKCDEKLFDLLDQLPCGIPEDGYQPNTFDYLYAGLIAQAFFKV